MPRTLLRATGVCARASHARCRRPAAVIHRRCFFAAMLYQAAAKPHAAAPAQVIVPAALLGFTPFAVLLLSAGHRGVSIASTPLAVSRRSASTVSCQGTGCRIQSGISQPAAGHSTAAPGFFSADNPYPAISAGPRLPWAFSSSRCSSRHQHAWQSGRACSGFRTRPLVTASGTHPLMSFGVARQSPVWATGVMTAELACSSACSSGRGLARSVAR